MKLGGPSAEGPTVNTFLTLELQSKLLRFLILVN